MNRKDFNPTTGRVPYTAQARKIPAWCDQGGETEIPPRLCNDDDNCIIKGWMWFESASSGPGPTIQQVIYHRCVPFDLVRDAQPDNAGIYTWRGQATGFAGCLDADAFDVTYRYFTNNIEIYNEVSVGAVGSSLATVTPTDECNIQGTTQCHGGLGFYGFIEPNATGVLPIGDGSCGYFGIDDPIYGIILERKDCNNVQCDYFRIFPDACGLGRTDETFQLEDEWSVSVIIGGGGPIEFPAQLILGDEWSFVAEDESQVDEVLNLEAIWDCYRLMDVGLDENIELQDEWTSSDEAESLINEQLILSDIWDGVLMPPGVFEETFQLEDRWTAGLFIDEVQQFTETFQLADLWTCTADFDSPYHAQLTLGDEWTFTEDANLGTSENARFGDVWTLGEDGVTSERLTLRDEWTVQFIFAGPAYREPLHLEDEWTFTTGIYSPVADTFQLEDQWDCVTEYPASWSEQLTLGDLWDCTLDLKTPFADTFQLGDEWTESLTAVATQTENINLGDIWDADQTSDLSLRTQGIALNDFWAVSSESEDLTQERIALEDQWTFQFVGRPPYSETLGLDDTWDVRVDEQIETDVSETLDLEDFWTFTIDLFAGFNRSIQLDDQFTVYIISDVSAAEQVSLVDSWDAVVGQFAPLDAVLTLVDSWDGWVRRFAQYSDTFQLSDFWEASLEDEEDLRVQPLILADIWDVVQIHDGQILESLSLSDEWDGLLFSNIEAQWEDTFALLEELGGVVIPEAVDIESLWDEQLSLLEQIDADIDFAECCLFAWCAEPYTPVCGQCTQEPAILKWAYEPSGGFTGEACCDTITTEQSVTMACSVSQTFQCGTQGGPTRLRFNGNDWVRFPFSWDPAVEDARWSALVELDDINAGPAEILNSGGTLMYVRPNSANNSWRMSYGQQGRNETLANLPNSGEEFLLEAWWKSNSEHLLRFNNGPWILFDASQPVPGSTIQQVYAGARGNGGSAIAGYIRDVKRLDPATGTPLNHWPMDEGSGTTLTDVIGGVDGDLGTGANAPFWEAGAKADIIVAFDFAPTGVTGSITLDDGTTQAVYNFVDATGEIAPYDCAARRELTFTGTVPPTHPNDPCPGSAWFAGKLVLNPLGNTPIPSGPGTPDTVTARVGVVEDASVCCQTLSLQNTTLDCAPSGIPGDITRPAGSCFWISDWADCGQDLAYRWWAAVYSGQIEMRLQVQQQVSAPIPYWEMRWTLDITSPFDCSAEYFLSPTSSLFPRSGGCPPGVDCTGNEDQWVQNNPCPEIDWKNTDAIFNPLGIPVLTESTLGLQDAYLADLDVPAPTCAGCTRCTTDPVEETSCDLCPPTGGGGFNNPFCLGAQSASLDCDASSTCRWTKSDTINSSGTTYDRTITVTVTASAINAKITFLDINNPVGPPMEVNYSKPITPPIDCTAEHWLNHVSNNIDGNTNNPCTGGAWQNVQFRWNPQSSCGVGSIEETQDEFG